MNNLIPDKTNINLDEVLESVGEIADFLYWLGGERYRFLTNLKTSKTYKKHKENLKPLVLACLISLHNEIASNE